ncbi:MAG: heme-binding protein [Rhodospirillales bacterium]|nr:heme-binding protein [Rhodospirillales bacterium]
MNNDTARRHTALTLETACTIIDAVLEAGRANGMLPLTVVVLDSGGHAMALKREDGSGILRLDIAIGKAYGALGLGVSSRVLRDVALDRPMFTTAVSVAAGGRFVPVPGGVLVCDPEGPVIGAVGVSGDTSDNDELCAIVGINAAGLVSDPKTAVGK